MKNETKLGWIAIGCLAAGLLLIWLKPEFWIITNIHTRVLGSLLVLAGVMWGIALIYTQYHRKRK